MSVIVDQIVVSDKFKYNNEVFKYFTGYQKGGIVKPLCIKMLKCGKFFFFLGNDMPK